MDDKAKRYMETATANIEAQTGKTVPQIYRQMEGFYILMTKSITLFPVRDLIFTLLPIGVKSL